MKFYAMLFGAVALLASLTCNAWQFQKIGAKNEALRNASAELRQAADVIRQTGEQLKEYQDGNVLNREQAAEFCRADVRAAYDAGRGFVRGETLSDRQSAGAFVPGQRKDGSRQ